MSDDSDSDLFIAQSHYLESLKHVISTDGILGDVLDLADKNKTIVDLRCDLFSDFLLMKSLKCLEKLTEYKRQ